MWRQRVFTYITAIHIESEANKYFKNAFYKNATAKDIIFKTATI
jgi:hypothetical protein